MFVHWGLYSAAARREWVQQQEQMNDDAYRRYFDRFDPDLYDPAAWAALAAAAGMRYVVLTAKHHEGFCLWDSALTDFKATNTPAARDLLSPFVDAFRAHGLRVGLYYSLLDWHHPDFVIDDLHPLRNAPDRDRLNEARVMERYARYVHGQVEELLTRYGDIDILWGDFTYDVDGPLGSILSAVFAEMGGGPVKVGKSASDWRSEELLSLVRRLRPGILVNDRLGLDAGWDVTTSDSEQSIPSGWPLVGDEPALWETCQTFSGSWGYHRDEGSWKDVPQLLWMLIDTVSKGGNMLLNVGPTSRGALDGRAEDRLRGIAEWMRYHDRSIYGCTEAPAGITGPADARLTYNPDGDRLYVHLLSWPNGRLDIAGFEGGISYAQLLNDGSEIRDMTFAEQLLSGGPTAEGAVALKLPGLRPDVAIPVVEVFLS